MIKMRILKMKNCALLLGLVFLLALTGNVRARAIDIDGYIYTWDYDDGYSWICYYTGKTIWLSSIDKTGTMTFQYDTEISGVPSNEDIQSVFSCSGGYMYLNYDHWSWGKFVSISPTGDVVTYSTDSEQILCYGDGYVATKSEYAGFDSSGYVYRIYDGSGTLILEEDSTYDQDSVHYCGKGVFGTSYFVDETTYYLRFYFTDRNEFVDVKYDWGDGDSYSFGVGYLGNFRENEDIMYLGCDIKSGSYELVFMDTEGNLMRIATDYKVNTMQPYFTPVVSDHKCVFISSQVSSEVSLIVCDLDTGEISEIYPSYEEKIAWRNMEDALTFNSERLVLPLTGTDGNSYVEVIDLEGNLLLEPTRADSYTDFSDGRMSITTSGSIDVYDESMNIVFSLSTDDYSGINEYSEEAALVSGNGHSPIFMDTNGELLFDEVKYASAGDATFQDNTDEDNSDETDSIEDENLENTGTDDEATESEKVFILGEDLDTDIDFETEASAEDGTGEETASFDDRWFEIYNHFVDDEGNDIILWVSDSSAGDYIDVECNGMIRFTVWADEYSLNYDGGYYYEDSPNESFLIWYPDTNAIVVCFGGAGGSYEFHYQAG